MQRSCFLFGHADTPHSILPRLEEAIGQEVSRGTTVFYVGCRGNFDRLAASALRAVKRRHSKITLILCLAYHPAERAEETPPDFDGTFYPPLEGVPRKYAIVRANQYMVRTADSVICYVQHWGNTQKLLDMARRRKLFVDNLADSQAPPAP